MDLSAQSSSSPHGAGAEERAEGGQPCLQPSRIKATWVRRTVREILALAFWLHALCVTGLLPHLPIANPDASRYLLNAALLAFIVNYSLFSDNGWWSVLFDLAYIYFLPFIYLGRLFWWATRSSVRTFKSKIIWQNPQLITVPPKTGVQPQGVVARKKTDEKAEKGRFDRIGRLFLKFSLLWSLLILTVNWKPFLILAVLVTGLGALRAIISLWGMFSSGSSWLDKIEAALAKMTAESAARIVQWDGWSKPEEIRNALNGLKLYSSILNFITDNTSILTSWAFTVSIFVSVPFYCYISLLFSCIYFGIAKIACVNFPWQEAFVDSLFMPFAWSALPANVAVRLVAGLQATCVSIIGYNILFRHIGNRLEKITSIALKLRDPIKADSFRTRMLEVERSIAQCQTGGKVGPRGVEIQGRRRYKRG